MSIEIQYRVGRKGFSTKESNAQLQIEEKKTENRHTVTITAKTDLKLKYAGGKTGVRLTGKDRFFLNGYQSWTDSKESIRLEVENNIYRLPPSLIRRFSFDRYGDAKFYFYFRPLLHGYDVFYSRGKNNSFFFNMNSAVSYLIFQVSRWTGKVYYMADLRGLSLRAGESLTVLDYCFAPDYESGVQLFRKMFSVKTPEKIFGYTSWYNYYQDINEAQILRDLEALDDRFNLFQIDDGYETYVGDWISVDPKKFPNGLSPIVEKIHAKGLKAGIWLAPFVAEEKSDVYRNHPEWLRRTKSGKPIKCGGNWSGFYALDLENKEAREHIEKSLRFFMDQGFDFFKLDFLYAANLPEYFGRTRSMVAEEAYAFLRRVLGDRLILGCGATPFNCAGKFDYLRVGPDVSLEFDDIWFMRIMHRERISTKVTLQNTVYRSFLNGVLFGNDPDVFILRDENVRLSKEQKRALLTINSLFGSVLMTSDNIAGYDGEKEELLNRAINCFYHAQVLSYERDGRRIRIEYLLDGERKNLVYDTKKGVLL
ncbi:MAG: alpha-galactosidase [Ruminococcaceae bacterium]|nr:alpha-galactosidase [Oscillospiraceae bacterium]